VILGRVVGEVWATRKDPRISGSKLLVIRPQGWYEPAFDTRHLIAVDDVHAGIGDEVVVCLGKPARASLGKGGDENFPVDAAVLGIVERVDLDPKASSPAGAAPGIRRRLELSR